MLPGRRGVTYRYWDWNRTYAADGREDPAGAPRELHLEAALDVTRWDSPRGEALLPRVRRRAGPPSLEGAARLEPLIGAGAPIESRELGVARLSGRGSLRVEVTDLCALTVLGGRVHVGSTSVARGRTAALRPGEHTLELDSAHAILSSAPR